jgi:hypothetical protein
MAKESKKEEVKGEEKPIEEMTVKELREVAKGISDITGVSSMKKEQLFEAIKKAKEEEGKKEEAPEQEAAAEEAATEEVPMEAKAGEEEPEQIEAKEEEAEVKEPEEIGEEEKPLDKMTATELREIAREIPDIEGAHAMKKEQLLEVIKKARGIKEEAPAEKKEKKGAESEAIIRDLKQKIILLKQEKEAARATKDKKKLDVLRRRINRLKKRTRKVAQAA